MAKQLYFNVVKGKQLGLVLSKAASEEDAELLLPTQELLEENIGNCVALSIDRKKSDGYLRRKYFQLIACTCKLPERVLAKFIGESAFKQGLFTKDFTLKDYVRKSIAALVGFIEPEIVQEKDMFGNITVTIKPIAKSIEKMEDEELQALYVATRDYVFEACSEIDNFTMFEAFGCLYLGFEMKHIQEVEKQLGFMEVQFHNDYLRLCKMTNAPLTVEQFITMHK